MLDTEAMQVGELIPGYNAYNYKHIAHQVL